MQQWEYTVINAGMQWGPMADDLNSLGWQGWEVVATMAHTGTTVAIILKRPISK